jgi:hypothetical protein
MKFNKKVKVFGRSIPAVAIALIAIAALASAGLLSYYGMITGTATVSQSVKVDGKSYTEPITYTYSGVAGSTVVDGPHNLTNDAQVPATVKFETSCCNSTSGQCGYGTGQACEGITTTYVNKLHLENKNASWGVISGDEIEADLTYEIVNETFNYELTATGLTPNTSYSLIYYADKQNRFAKWGGDTIGAVIVTVSSDANGKISTSGIKELGKNLPDPADWNDGPDACAEYSKAPDNYTHCKGAKIWLVPTSNLTNDNSLPLDAWDPSSYLFETDLIRYFNNAESKVTIPANGRVDFYIVNSFKINLIPDTYKITTTVVPA